MPTIPDHLPNDKHIAVVLASSLGALAAIRELGKQSVPVIAVGQTDYIGKSRYCTWVKIHHEHDLLAFLQSLAQKVEKKPIIFTDDPQYADFLFENWSFLDRHFLVPMHPVNRQLTDSDFRHSCPITDTEREEKFRVTLYRNAIGKVSVGFIAHLIEQYPFHQSWAETLCLTTDNPELAEHAVKLLEEANYSGIATIEYQYCSCEKTFSPVRVNGFLPAETSISQKLPQGFVYQIYRDLISPSPTTFSTAPGMVSICWFSLIPELFAMFAARKFRFPSILRYYFSYQAQTALMDFTDPLPFYYYLPYLLKSAERFHPSTRAK